MRILYVGGIHFARDAERFYGVAQKLINGFIRLGHTVLCFSDRDASRNNNLFKSRLFGVKKANQALLEKVKVFQPDLILFNHADVIWPRTLEDINRLWPHIRMAQVNVDALFNPDNIARIRKKSGLVHANFFTTYGRGLLRLKNNNKPLYYIPNPVDASIESGQAFQNSSHWDLFIALGAFYPTFDERRNTISHIQISLPQLKFAVHISAEKKGIWGAHYYDVLKSCKSGLNLSRKAEKNSPPGLEEDFYLYSSDRISHYVGNGLLTYSDEAFSLHELFKREEEMVFYRTVEELVEKIRFYEKNDAERKRVAQNGWRAYHKNFHESLVARFILERTMELPLSCYAWPTHPY